MFNVPIIYMQSQKGLQQPESNSILLIQPSSAVTMAKKNVIVLLLIWPEA